MVSWTILDYGIPLNYVILDYNEPPSGKQFLTGWWSVKSARSRIPVTTRTIKACLASEITINLHLSLFLGGGHTQHTGFVLPIFSNGWEKTGPTSHLPWMFNHFFQFFSRLSTEGEKLVLTLPKPKLMLGRWFFFHPDFSSHFSCPLLVSG